MASGTTNEKNADLSSSSSSLSSSAPAMDLAQRLDALLPCARLPTDHDRAAHGVPQPFSLGTVGPKKGFRCPFLQQAAADRKAVLVALYAALIRRYVREAEVAVGLVTAGGAWVGVPMHGILAREGLSAGEAAAAVAVLFQNEAPLADMLAVAAGDDGLVRERLSTQAFTFGGEGASTTPRAWPLLCFGGEDVGLLRGWDVCLVADGGAFTLLYNAQLFSAAMAEAMLHSWETLLVEAASDATAPMDALPCVSLRDAQWLVQGCNQTAAAFAPRAGIHQLFEARMDENPQRIAIIGPLEGDDDDAAAYPERVLELTYGEVEAAANRMARHLLKLGDTAAADDAIVAILLERSVGFYLAMLGALKAGAAYLSIDPDYPDERIQYMLEDSGAVTLITTTALASRLRKAAAAAATLRHVLCLDDPVQAAAMAREPTTRAEWVAVDPEWLCYVIYTSGSTGKPKGVQISHANALNLIRAEEVIYCIEPADRVLQGFSTSFDASVEEIWMAFNSGAALVVGTKEIMRSGPDFPSYIEALGVTCLSTVPTLLASVRKLLVVDVGRSVSQSS